MVNKKWLLLPVEIKAREFHSRLLLGLEAVSRGYGVIIGSKPQIKYRLPQLPKGIFFDKALSKVNLDRVKKEIIDQGFILVSNDEEGLGSIGNEWSYLNERHSNEMLNLAHRFFTWGEAEANLLRNHYPAQKNKIIPTGNPRVDIWKSEFKKIFCFQANEYKKKYGNFILMPSSFGITRHASGINFVYNQYKKRGVFKTDEGKKNFKKRFEFTNRSMHKFEQLAKRIASELKKKIIFRPHPSEDQSEWKRVFRNYPTIHVIQKGEISPWILASDMVIHSFCTTGLEAFLMKKPVIAYKSENNHRYAEFLSNRVGLIRNSESDVLEAIMHIGKGMIPQSILRKEGIQEIENVISSIHDEEYAYQKILDELSSINEWKVSNFEKLQLLKWRARKKNWMYQINNWIGKAPEQKKVYATQKFDYLNKTELKEVIQLLVKEGQFNQPDNINQISKDVFALFNL